VTKSARWLLAAVTLTFCVIAAACGDDSGSSTATTGSAATTGAAAGTTGAATTGSTGTAAPAIVFKALDAGGPLTTGALDSGDIQIALLFSSQGIIAQKGWIILADDKKLQPVDNLVPVIRTDIAKTPGVSEALNKVSAALTTDELSKLNLEVDVDKKDPADVAKEFLTEKNLIGEANGSDGLAGVKVTVGSANFSEQEIVANMYALVLQNNSADVTTKFKLGSREVVAPALEKGDIDVYPEYVGTYLTFLGGTPSSDLDKTVADLRAAAEPKGITVLDPSPAEDVNALVVTKATADKYSLVNISDLTSVPDQLTMGGPPECPERPFCILGFEKTYGLTFKV
jgi:osmoprotectant transport system substrate-binding protein